MQQDPLAEKAVSRLIVEQTDITLDVTANNATELYSRHSASSAKLTSCYVNSNEWSHRHCPPPPANSVCPIMCPQNVPILVVVPGPIPCAQPCQYLKWHVDRFNRFCRAHWCVQQPDRPRYMYIGNNRPHLMLRIALQPTDSNSNMLSKLSYNS